MAKLVDQRCNPIRSDEPPLSEKEIKKHQSQIPEWDIVERDGVPSLQRSFKVVDFNKALEFTNKIGRIAEEEDHHPVLIVRWGKVLVKWWTDAISNLSMNDFIMAAKTDEIYAQRE